MDIVNQAMLYLLNALHTLFGSYGWAIIALTVGIRLLLWPMNSAQTRSMRKMQELQPKLKVLQERHKDDPTKLQQEMMKFYSENKFNPLAGCLPLLVQLPIFIGLFGALNSPEFLESSAKEQFLFINKLYHTLHSHAGEPMDNNFRVQAQDSFMTGQMATWTMSDGQSLAMKIADPAQAIQFSPNPMIPGRPVDLTVNLPALGITDKAYYGKQAKEVQLLVVNNKSKELERLNFTNHNGWFQTKVPTVAAPDDWDISHWNFDVFILIVLYGLVTLAYQKVMTPAQPVKVAEDPQAQAQAKMMKFLPLMFVVMMFFIPMPAGVMIYLVVTTLMMLLQTWYVNFSESQKEGHTRPSDKIVEVKAD